MGTQTVTVEHDLASIPIFLDALATQAVKKAVATSIRRTFITLKKDIAQEITRRRLVNTRTLPQRDIKARYLKETQQVNWKMPISDMQARIDFSKKKPSLIHFWAKRIPVYLAPQGKAKRGKRKTAFGSGKHALSAVQVTVMGKTYVTGKAFMPGSTGLRTIFVRTTVHRTPLRVLRGPSFATMFEKLEIVQSLQRSAQSRYGQEFEHQFEFYLKQLTDKQAAKTEK